MWRLNFTHLSALLIQTIYAKKKCFKFLWLTWAKNDVLLKLSATITCWQCVNEIIFFVSKMGQTKHKPLRIRDVLRFYAWNGSLHLEHILFKTMTRKKTSLCTSNMQILKFLKVINILQIVSKTVLRLLWAICCSWLVKNLV